MLPYLPPLATHWLRPQSSVDAQGEGAALQSGRLLLMPQTTLNSKPFTLSMPLHHLLIPDSRRGSSNSSSTRCSLHISRHCCHCRRRRVGHILAASVVVRGRKGRGRRAPLGVVNPHTAGKVCKERVI